MSKYYKPNRNKNWNYDGNNWRLSRSKIDLFVECPRCFYIDNKLGTARPPGYPFSLNSAVDHLLKKEFDIHRSNKSAHPFMVEHGIDALPFQSEFLDDWRDNFKGVEVKHGPTGLTVSGAIDDVWQNPQGELHVVDYKATSKNESPTLDADWQDGYKRQMEIYQWLLRQSGFKVSNVGYFVYANGLKDKESFGKKLEFEVVVIPYEGEDSWIEGVLSDIKETLDKDDIPDPGADCDFCSYREAVRDVIKDHMGIPAKAEKANKKPENQTLF